MASRWARTRKACAAAALAAAALAGCAGRPAATTPVVRPMTDLMVSPVARGGEDGLEVVWFVARDEDDAVARALAPYTHQALPISDDLRRRLEANGLRLVRVPLADLPGIESSLRVVGARQRQWLGWALEWREVFRGRSLDAGQTMLLDGQRASSRGGALRLIGRAWTAPGAGDPAALRLRVELAPQIDADPARRVAAAADPLALQPPPTTVDVRGDGPTLAHLAIDAELEPGWAYILTADLPGADWASLARGDAPPPAPEPEDGLTPAEPALPAPAGPVAGPPVAAPPTLGEAMLTNVGRADAERPAKAVVAMIPRVPARGAPAARAASDRGQ